MDHPGMKVPRISLIVGLLALAPPALGAPPEAADTEPFKVGTFQAGGKPFVGLVLRDALIVELGPANTDFETATDYPALSMPEDMLALIGEYEYGLKYRLYEIANHLVAASRLSGERRPAYVHGVNEVNTLAPIRYPTKVMNAAVNFYSHIDEAASEAERREAMHRRRENRGAPYIFLKPTRGAIIGNGEPIVIPHGRTRTDWEVELATVIGRPAKYVSAVQAEDYVFGYMVSIDVSDRGGRPPGGFDAGIDWFVGKGHDTFAPQGPWIVPKEFYGNPMERLHQQLTIDGITVQEARAGDMIHSLWELIEYASSIITLFPGDVLNSGTSGGTAAGASEKRGQGGFLKPGETIEASIEGIGTLRMPVVAGEVPPEDLTGSNLPPVESYRE
jgi:2-keto-4-pentenoate hydratase/2-oxohepta-3-ene-1,7-dioic acid hydratase in catechol pathway